jgi:hypothetical protein
MHCIVLHRAASCCIALHRAALCCIVPHCTASHCIVLHCTQLHCGTLYWAARLKWPYYQGLNLVHICNGARCGVRGVGCEVWGTGVIFVTFMNAVVSPVTGVRGARCLGDIVAAWGNMGTLSGRPIHCTALHCTALHCTALHLSQGRFTLASLTPIGQHSLQVSVNTQQQSLILLH